MLSYLWELIGTFIFLYVCLSFSHPIIIGITLVALLFFGSRHSKIPFHGNPGLALALFLSKRITISRFLIYLILQFTGAYLAYLLYTTIHHPTLISS